MAFNDKARATIAAKKALAASTGAAQAVEANSDLAAREAALAKREADLALRESTASLESKLADKFHVEQSGEAPKAPAPNLFSGTMPRLAVYGKNGADDPIPGYRLYWFNDIEGGYRVNAALQSGWEYVQNEEIALNNTGVGAANSDLGSNVRRFVENGPGGAPVYAYLMKKPLWLHERHEYGPDSREQRIHQRVEAELRAGTLNQQPGDARYTPGNMPQGLPASTLGAAIKIESGQVRR